MGEYTRGIADAVLKDQSLGVFVYVRYPWTRGEDVYVAIEQF